MKYRLLFFAVALCTISCNNDDENVAIPQEKNLKSISVFNNDGDSNIDETTIFENNRPIDNYIYDLQGQVISHQKFTYNPSGQLVLTEKFNGNNEILNSGAIVYDTTGRMIGITSLLYFDIGMPGLTYNTNFTYNADNTITRSTSNLFEPVFISYVFHIDNQGFVSKIIGDSEDPVEINYDIVDDAQYVNGNITQWSRNGYFDEIGEYELLHNYTFIYDAETEVKGKYLDIYRLQFGNDTNIALYGMFDYTIESSHNYIIQKTTENGDIYTFEYEFDTDGYPIKKLVYLNNTLKSEINIEYL